MMNPVYYSLPAPLVQAIVSQLNEMPAKMSRGLLNAIEFECSEQDKARSQAELQEKINQAKAEEK